MGTFKGKTTESRNISLPSSPKKGFFRANVTTCTLGPHKRFRMVGRNFTFNRQNVCSASNQLFASDTHIWQKSCQKSYYATLGSRYTEEGLCMESQRSRSLTELLQLVQKLRKSILVLLETFLDNILRVSVYEHQVQTTDWRPYTEPHCESVITGIRTACIFVYIGLCFSTWVPRNPEVPPIPCWVP